MTEIAEDILQTVTRIMAEHEIDYDKALTGQAIAETILAERERCIAIIKRYSLGPHADACACMVEDIQGEA